MPRLAAPVAAVALAAAGCLGPLGRPAREAAAPGPSLGEAPSGEALVACGRRLPAGVRVVTWEEPPGYDASATAPRFAADGPRGLRYRPGRAAGDPALEPRIAAGDLDALRERVDLLVLHYDACGTSRRCFQVLHDVRQLSVHFLVDVDGTIYQTLDLRDQAWHASDANPRSIGVEIAHPGAWPPAEARERLATWYAADAGGVRLVLPETAGETGVRTPGFVARPASEAVALGRVHGRELAQRAYTREQLDAVVALATAVCRHFPRIAPDAPRDAAGRVRTDALGADELARFGGIVGHHHLTERKVDPGPAFPWETVLARVRARLGVGP